MDCNYTFSKMNKDDVKKIVEQVTLIAKKEVEQVTEFAKEIGVMIPPLRYNAHINKRVEEKFKYFYKIDGLNAEIIFSQIHNQKKRILSDLNLLSIGKLPTKGNGTMSISIAGHRGLSIKALKFFLNVDYETMKKQIDDWKVKEYKNGRLDMSIPQDYFRKIYALVMQSSPETDRVFKIITANLSEFNAFKTHQKEIRWKVHEYLYSKNISHTASDINFLLLERKLKGGL